MDRGKLEKGLEINDKIADIKKDRTIIEGYLEESILNMSKCGRVSRIFKKGCNLSALFLILFQIFLHPFYHPF